MSPSRSLACRTSYSRFGAFFGIALFWLNVLSCSSTPSHGAAGPGGSSTVSGGALDEGGASSEGGGAGVGGCSSDTDSCGTPFQAPSVASYVAKVKNLLVALPATDRELQAVSSDPKALKGLIQGWQKLPQYQAKMERFFELAFQQTQISMADLADQSYPKQLVTNAATAPLLTQNVQQSFARTVLALNAAGQPFTVVTSTPQLMMTTALKELYAFLDVYQVNDDGKVSDGFKTAHSTVSVIAEAAQGPIPIAETLDETSPNYMHWYDPDVASPGKVAACSIDPITFPSSAFAIHRLLYGSLDGWKGPGGIACPPIGGTATAAQLTADDFSDWQLVTVRPPKAGESVSAFYDLPALRKAKELVVTVPRLGFFSTPAFFANWQTNVSNQMRVTLNQSLIVALGGQVDGTDSTRTPGDPPPGLDALHSASAPCLRCHQLLDPLRSIFSATYSWNYHRQQDATWSKQPGLFAFQGVTQSVQTMDDFGAVLAKHPMFAAAWVQKLCFYANSAACSVDDPEFKRLVALFQSSKFDWDTLVSELFSSALVTHASQTSSDEVVAVARRDHLCATLDVRLGFEDVCGLHAVTAKQSRALIPSIAAGLPSDGYGRGSVAPVLPNQPTLFYRAGLENICEGVAAQTIDVKAASQMPNVKQWTSSDPDAAIADFVSVVMALTPGDPRALPATKLLRAHFDQALAKKATASNALKSTFVVACLAPSAVSVGL